MQFAAPARCGDDDERRTARRLAAVTADYCRGLKVRCRGPVTTHHFLGESALAWRAGRCVVRGAGSTAHASPREM